MASVIQPEPGIASNDHETVGIELQIARIEPVAASIEPEIASNEPEIESTELSEPSPASPIRDGDEPEDASSDEAIYDIDYLSHDPGKRIPINYDDFNDRNAVIRGYIALGPCQPCAHEFPIRKIGVTCIKRNNWLFVYAMLTRKGGLLRGFLVLFMSRILRPSHLKTLLCHYLWTIH